MEEKQLGLIEGIQCQFIKTDPLMISLIAEKRGIPEDRIKYKMRYNIFTINQFCDLTGLSVSAILNKTRPSVINGEVGTELNFCYPFRDEENDGPKFVVRDDKAIECIKSAKAAKIEKV